MYNIITILNPVINISLNTFLPIILNSFNTFIITANINKQ
jgi:hypothetical protein